MKFFSRCVICAAEKKLPPVARRGRRDSMAVLLDSDQTAFRGAPLRHYRHLMLGVFYVINDRLKPIRQTTEDATNIVLSYCEMADYLAQANQLALGCSISWPMLSQGVCGMVMPSLKARAPPPSVP
jgi:hypothetical protein